MRFSVGGRSTSADADEPIAALWNPHSSIALRVTRVEFVMVGTGGMSSAALMRTTTRGTAGSTVTPGVNNALDRRAGPPSGALLDLGNYTAAPTLAPEHVARVHLDPRTGAGFEWRFLPRGLYVPPGTGLALVTLVTITGAVEVAFEWLE